ncbi:MAG: hypothetical protein IPK44_14680 [Candidatus Accumulibacter sp.]|uniref:hypothetical protein n=1 Tax=Accumulibacter sp. TaxID=2053492 RepID=UPI002584598D|nr:hypothetical protein [Accumulibacter sp.]MBK8115671.1 hypothetical protein [Accumulibacter sp.]
MAERAPRHGFAFVRDAGILREAFWQAAPMSSAVRADPYARAGDVASFPCAGCLGTLKAFGREGYRAIVERCVDNAAVFARWIEAQPGLELMNPSTAQHRLLSHRARGSGRRASTDALNRAAS